jgi:hypothetical protein
MPVISREEPQPTARQQRNQQSRADPQMRHENSAHCIRRTPRDANKESKDFREMQTKACRRKVGRHTQRRRAKHKGYEKQAFLSHPKS